MSHSGWKSHYRQTISMVIASLPRPSTLTSRQARRRQRGFPLFDLMDRGNIDVVQFDVSRVGGLRNRVASLKPHMTGIAPGRHTASQLDFVW